MKTSVTVSIITVAIATIGISAISKTVSASSHAPLIAISQQQVETPASKVPAAAQLRSLAKISASQAQQTAEAAQGNKASSVKLENEDGNLIYAVNIGQNEIAVDAGNGRILYTQNTIKEEAESESHPRSSIQVPGAEVGETNDDGNGK